MGQEGCEHGCFLLRNGEVREIMGGTERQVSPLCRRISITGRLGYTLSKISRNKVLQRGEVQDNLVGLNRRSCRARGTKLGRWPCACGETEKKSVILFHKSASAVELSLPGICIAECPNLKCASKKNKHLIRCNTRGSLDVLFVSA